MMYVNGQAVAPTKIIGINDKTTPDYVTDGLIALYDGLKNTSDGHANQPTKWADISGNSRDLTSIFSNNIFIFDGAYFYQNSMEMRYTGDTPMETVKTVEIVFKQTRNTAQMIMQLNRSKKGIYLYNSGNTIQFNTGAYGFTIDGTKRNAVSYDYENDKCYINGTDTAHNTDTDTWSTSYNYDILLQDYHGTANDFFGEICSIRLYNRSLTEAERQHNLAIDAERFGVA